MEGLRRRLVALSLLATLVVACTGGEPEAPASPEMTPAESIVMPMGPDGPELPEDVVAELQAYGAMHVEEFGGLYVEDQSRGSFVMLFTDRLEEHATALAEIWPRVTVRGVRYSEAALLEVLESLDLAGMAGPGLEPLSAGLDTVNNVVTLELKSDDPTLETRLELQYGGMVDVTVHPLPGAWANVAEGDGWRLLAAGKAGPNEAYTVRAATDEAGWDDLWAAVAIGDDRPVVDLDAEVVVSFAQGIGSSCPELRLDDVVISGGVVFSVTSDPLQPRACTSDLAGAAAFVVAVAREALPSDGFTLQLAEWPVTGHGDGSPERLDVPLP